MLKKILIIFSFYFAYLFLIFIFQRSLIYPGKYIKTSGNVPVHSGLKRIWIDTSVGRIEAWFSPVKDLKNGEKRPAVMFAHGNYEIIDYNYREALRYNRLGIHAFLIEYPGYGRSEGSPSQETIEETFIKAYDWLIDNPKVDVDRIIAHGRSLGGGAVCLLASKRNVRALILQSTFTDLGQFAWSYFAPPFLVRDPFNNLSVVASFNGPILIFHGKYDDVIPYKNGVKLHKNARMGRLITMDCHHNNCPVDGDEFWGYIREFLKRI